MFQFGIYKDNDFNENNYKIADIFFNERKIEKIKKAKKIETSVTKIKLFITT